MMKEGCSSASKQSWSFKDEFTDLMFSWSLEEILNENLYKNQVEKIPETFQSIDEYFGSFIYPLLEETRAELASAMEIIHKAPFAEITYFNESKRDQLLYDVKVDNWRTRVHENGSKPYRTIPGDILLLSNSKPETASDLNRVGWNHAFAYVTNISEHEEEDENGKCIGTNFKVKFQKSIEGGEWNSKSVYVVFLMNISTNKRIWNALRMRRNVRIIEKVLSKKDLDEEHCLVCPLNNSRQLEDKFESTLLSELNESQCEAVLVSLDRIQCDHTSSVELIWGPPGTGKTRTLSVLLYGLLKMNVRTLVCAPTNIAITELASRLIKLIRDSSEVQTGEAYTACPLGVILLFGNKDRLKVGSEIEEIFLDYRVDKLVNCLVSLTGWKPCLVSMQDFLQNCVSQHRIYVDNGKSKECLDDGIQQSTTKSLLEFARDRFQHVASPLRKSMLTFFTHIPARFLGNQNIQNMKQLLFLLDSIEKLLFHGNMTPEEFENVFSQPVITSGFDSFVFQNTTLLDTVSMTLSLQQMRGQCLCFITSLQFSLTNLGLPLVRDRTSIIDFCFQKSSLIFCTTSSSYRLHLVNAEPVKLVVIDEAAQVKECESVIALQISNVKHAILVGDEWQLPALVTSNVSKEAGIGRSLFERLSSLGHTRHLLNMQYRMHPSICRFPSSNFYLNKILNAPNVRSQSYERCYLQGKIFGPYSFINIIGGKEELDDVGHSRRNMVEVAVAVKLVERLYKAWNGSEDKLSIGLISPYAAQVVAIQGKLNQKYENLENFIVNVKSVDGFQGGEQDIIIISTVRCNIGGSIGFLSSPQRSNVALTRARHCLWILGDEWTLSNSDSVWEALIRDAKNRKCFFTSDEDSSIAKAIIDVKKELLQLDDMLNGDSVLFKNARWEVLFSQNFRKSFETLKASQVKKLVINMLLKIASGWRPKKTNVDMPCKSSSYSVKQFKLEGYSVICSIDIKKDSQYKQVVKVWDVLPTTEIQKLLNRLDSIFTMYTDDFIRYCSAKRVEGNLEVPLSWPTTENIVRYKDLNSSTLSTTSSSAPRTSAMDSRTYVENSRVSESLLLMKFYSLSHGSVKYLLSDGEGRQVDLPFEVTDEEHETIIFPKTSFILGRSGTGKTTVLTMKLYRRLHQYHMASGAFTDGNRIDEIQCPGESNRHMLRQLFVTVSPRLCYAIKHHISQLKSFAGGNFSDYNSITDIDDLDEMSEFEDIPDTFESIEPDKYPLIITFHKFLMMLDGTLNNSYFERFRDVRDAYQSQGRLRSVALQTFIRKSNVTYDRFSSIYWPHFNEKLTKNLDPSRVFTEIVSHIKGCMLTGETGNGRRSKEDYILLSDSRVSTLSAEKRELIYDVFQDYEKMKVERGDFDVADIVNDIHLRLNKDQFLGDKMDFVYIDEVQDLTMRQIALFRHVCENVDEGFVFSGDTAQTIARGIDFRFEDIRSLFYNEFLMKSKRCELSGGRKEKGLISDTFHLCHNFRTHSGVLRLAQSVIDLICHFFPQSIDVLDPETSLICGESPILLEPGTDENAILTIFGQSANASGNSVGFGAEQVIIVRDESVKKDISRYIGRQALILTIVECKGLEFQDVLLYNFFGSSPLSNQWRVLYQYLDENDLLDADCPRFFPCFSQTKHNILSSELKQLYVAITRTRQRLWICENNTESSKPMFAYWMKLGLVQVRKVDDSLAQAMQRASSPEEWKSQGIKLFWEKNYEMATMCFEKAGEEMWEKRAKASGLRAVSDQLRSSNSKEAHIMLREAAEIFDSIGLADYAAQCFCDLGEYERAGNIYIEKCGTSAIRKAGECFILSGSYKTAAEVYCKGNFFAECLSACIKGKYFEMGLQYMEYWKQKATWDTEILERYKEINKVGQEFLGNCAIESYERKDKEAMMKFVRAFSTLESKRSFLKSRDCLSELLVLEEESQNFVEASEIAMVIGNVLLEVDLLGKAEKFVDASFLCLSYVLCNSLWVSTIQGWPLKSFPQKKELLTKAMSFAEKVSESFHACICVEARVFSHEPKTLSDLMQSYVASRETKHRTGEILLVRKLLDVHFQANLTKYGWELGLPSDPKRCLEESILKSEVSVRTLFYIWNLLKENILDILECLEHLEKDHDDKIEPRVEFCQKYFGVRMSRNVRVTCVLLNPDAGWVKNVDQRFIQWNRNVASLETRHFVLAARKYWVQEFVIVGLRVLDILQALYKFSVDKSLSNYCQGTCLTCIFDIAKFFLDHKSFDIKKGDVWKLSNYLQLSTGYFRIVFPLDSRQSLSENMIGLRETEVSKNLLEEIISTNISTRSPLTHGQIGRAVMIWLGSGKPKYDLYEKIAGRFCENEQWKSFIEILYHMKDSQKLSKSSDFVEERLEAGFGEALSHKFHLALKETYDANWRVRDYISPNCFIYLLERLLIVLPHPQGFLFASKSSFVEWLMYLQASANPLACSNTENKFDTKSITDFVLFVVQQFLCNSRDTEEWIKLSNLNSKYYSPVLILRLFMILCCLCLNFEVLSDVVFMLVPQFQSILPRGFYEAVRRRGRYGYSLSISQVAKAFSCVGDPLVVVTLGDKKPAFVCPDAIFLDLKEFSCKDEIIKGLFPRKTETCASQLIEAKKETKATELGSVPIRTIEPTSGKRTETESDMSSINGQGDLQKEPAELLREIADMLQSLQNDKSDGNLKSLILRKKILLEEHVKCLSAAFNGEGSNSSQDIAVRMEDSKHLLSLLDISNSGKMEFMAIGEILKRLESSYIRSSPPVIIENITNTSVATVDEIVESDDNCESETEQSAVLVNKPSQHVQGKGNKNKKKPQAKNKKKQGKGKKR